MQMTMQRPNDISLKNKLTEALMNANQWEAAENFAHKSLEQDPNNFTSNFLLGIILHQKKQFDQAAAVLEKALTIQEDAQARYSLAVLYLYFLHNKEKGLFHLNEGLKKNTMSVQMSELFKKELEKNQK